MTFETLLYTVEDRVARIMINQPDKMNRLSNAVLQELTCALDHAQRDQGIKVLIITGAGNKAFCAGADLSSISAGGILQSRENFGHYASLCLAFSRLSKPSIAMIKGYALAGGCGLAMLPTFSIASENAKFGLPEINVGMWPMMVMSILFRTVGRKKGLELICTGEMISAEQAERIGMITKVVADSELERHVAELAGKLKDKSGSVMQLGLEAFEISSDMEFRKAIHYLREMVCLIGNTPDCKEGTTAFKEKRKPQWST